MSEIPNSYSTSSQASDGEVIEDTYAVSSQHSYCHRPPLFSPVLPQSSKRSRLNEHLMTPSDVSTQESENSNRFLPTTENVEEAFEFPTIHSAERLDAQLSLIHDRLSDYNEMQDTAMMQIELLRATVSMLVDEVNKISRHLKVIEEDKWEECSQRPEYHDEDGNGERWLHPRTDLPPNVTRF